MALRIEAAVRGRLSEHMEAEQRAIRRGINHAVRGATDDLKNETRAAVGRRLSHKAGRQSAVNAIRSKFFDNADGTITGLVYSKFGRKDIGGEFVDALLAHTAGATIRPRRSQALFLPVAATLQRRRRTLKGDRLREYLAGLKNVAFIKSSRGVTVVVRRTRNRTHLLGFIVSRVRVPKRIDLDPILAKHERDFPGRLIASIDQEAA